jgi:hypothetical protein
MTTSLAQWRRRCIAAEERAFDAERALSRSKAKVSKLADELAEVLSAYEGASQACRVTDRIIRRLAALHLGDPASPEEIDALVQRWVAEDRKRSTKRSRINVVVHISPNDLLRRLGFDPEDDG